MGNSVVDQRSHCRESDNFDKPSPERNLIAMSTPEKRTPVIADIEAAAKRIEGKVIKTPLLRNPHLDKISGATVFIKHECLQTTGSFKLRGASNALALLDPAVREKGVVACSSGNHAQGVAEAARRLGIPATIVMPSDAPAIKIKRTRRSGATVVTYDRETEDRDRIAADICEQNGSSFVHPFDNPNVIAGQGTCGLELADEVRKRGGKLDRILVCCGGGGLTSGIAIAVRNAFPDARIHPVEPAGFDDFTRSLESGRRVANDRLGGSMLTQEPGEITFDIARRECAHGIVVDDGAARRAVRFAFEELKLVVEPGGAVALAGLLEAGRKYTGETIGVILSGGNADPSLYADILSSG